MGKILQYFTITRNIMGRNSEVSASRLRGYIDLVADGLDEAAYAKLSKGEKNDISALATYTGLFEPGPSGGYVPTELNRYYRTIQNINSIDAWQWLITRSLWHYVIPNDSSSPLNKLAREQGIKFNFFRSIIGLLSMLNGLKGEDRYLQFHELCLLFDDDKNWSDSPVLLFNKVLAFRSNGVVIKNRRLIDDLETEFGISRDNLNTVIVKAFSQTGLFNYIDHASGTKTAIALSNRLTAILQRRLRHVLDNEIIHADPDIDFRKFIASHSNDLPLEVDKEAEVIELDDIILTDLSSIPDDLNKSLSEAGLVYEDALLKRFASSLLAKPFLILTGLSGSGKTKLAHAFAAWLTPMKNFTDVFSPGNRIESERITYYIINSDDISVEFSNNEDPELAILVSLPRAMIEEWASYIENNSLDRDVSARQIRENVTPISKYSPQLHSFETHLKAAAFALIESRKVRIDADCYRIISVGADWTSNENILGYPDALQQNAYKKPISGSLDLVLRAMNDKERPYFLILDEMNLSHVERYFADILSAIESGQAIALHCAGGPLLSYKEDPLPVPSEIRLPDNLFIIGTVNIDETTYMFSPKVLDRANVIEFHATADDIAEFLDAPARVNMAALAGKGAPYGRAFVNACKTEVSIAGLPPEICDGVAAALVLKGQLKELFEKMEPIGAEFGFRTAYEISRFIYHHAMITGTGWNFNDALDAQIVQKLMPKLHGSKKKLGPVLDKLKEFCEGRFPISEKKIVRMQNRLAEHGFTSFTEA